MTMMTTTRRLPLHSIVLLAVVLIVAMLQIPYLLTIDTSTKNDFFALPSNLTFDSSSLQNLTFDSLLGLQNVLGLQGPDVPGDLTYERSKYESEPAPDALEKKSSTDSDLYQHQKPYCYNITDRAYCCADSWQHNLDTWWQHHPDWEPSLEDDTHYCFSPIQDAIRATLLRDTVYPLQWRQDSCINQTFGHMMINSGYSANLGLLGRAFLTASLNNKTFVESRKKPGFLWRYANRNGTGICPTADMDCYFLPISSCKAELSQHQGFDKQLIDKHGGSNGKKITFLRNYMVRPKLWLRKRVYDLLRDVKFPLQPCTVMHVRRTDVVLEGNWRKARHYFAVADYLKEVEDSNVLLLTDDQTAIEEVLEHHGKEKNWSFLERKRWRGTEGGMNGHLPSGDPTLEVAYILAEQRLASQCRKLVYTRSGFADILLQAMQIKQWDIIKTRIDIGRQPNSTYFVTADQFFEKMHAQRNAAATIRT